MRRRMVGRRRGGWPDGPAWIAVGALLLLVVSAARPSVFRESVALPPPQGLTADEVGAHQVDLTWSAVQGAVHYTIYRDGQLVGRSALTFFSDVGLREDTDYEYRVRAVDTAGAEGGASSKEKAETEEDDDSDIDESPPSTPSGLTATATTDSAIDLGWAPSTDAQTGVSEYRVWRNGILVARPGPVSWSDTGLQASTAYTYRVAAVNGDGKVGSPSAVLSVTTSPGPDTSPPSAPSGLSATSVTASSVGLSWGAASDPESGVSGYNVYRDGSIVGSSTGTSFTDGTVSASTTYDYVVRAVNGAGLEGPPSGTLSVTTSPGPDTSPPSAPSGLSATSVTASSVGLSWGAASDPESGVSRYRLYRDDALVASPRSLAFSDTTVVGGRSYRYEVSALNGAGLEGARSSPAQVTTPEPVDRTPPAPPQGLRIVRP